MPSLADAAAGLLYTSESDYPFEPFTFANGSAADLTPSGFLARLGLPDATLIEEWTLDRFFARHIEQASAADAHAQALRPRYEALKRAIVSALRDVRVFRVGEIQVRCYVAGLDADGHVSGLATTAVET